MNEAIAMITVAGPPSSGKTSVIIHALRNSALKERKSGVIKFDCLTSVDEQRYNKYGILARTGIAGNLCPDHYFISNLEECFQWGTDEHLDLLILESAGLCNRCAPHLQGLFSVCVLDSLSGIDTPLKTGPMLKMAEIVVVTKCDLVSQAEREVFRFRIGQVNPRATVYMINGITGEGADPLAKGFLNAARIGSAKNLRLRFPMPSAVCSYCLGETRAGKDFRVGLRREIYLF